MRASASNPVCRQRADVTIASGLKWIDPARAIVHRRYHHQRQNSITAEVLDVIAGSEAVAH